MFQEQTQTDYKKLKLSYLDDELPQVKVLVSYFWTHPNQIDVVKINKQELPIE